MPSPARSPSPAGVARLRAWGGFLLLLLLAGPAQASFRRPVDVGFIRQWPSHGGPSCVHGITGAGCRFDCDPAGTGAPEDSSGIYYQCPAGTPVLAAAEGMVVQLFNDCAIFDTTCQGGLGNWVLLEHPWGLRTLYAHLSGTTVNPGDRLTCAAILGFAGQTGDAAVEGLRFEVQDLHYARIDPFEGACNPERPESLWSSQAMDDSARDCAAPFSPNRGWIGAPCTVNEDCIYPGAVCLPDWPGGACSGACETDPCPVHEGTGYVAPVCMATPDGAVCVSGCSRDLFPENGCRDQYVCQWLDTREGDPVPGCLPEPDEEPDGGLPDADGDAEPDPDADAGPEPDVDADAGPDITVGGAEPACACRSPAHHPSADLSFPFLLCLLAIWGLRKRIFPLSCNG